MAAPFLINGWEDTEFFADMAQAFRKLCERRKINFPDYVTEIPKMVSGTYVVHGTAADGSLVLFGDGRFFHTGDIK